ncbi:PREDICTED: N-acetyltransferase 9 isoform X2 [Papilio xuthus]|uniref:N-acetyltransferase 9 isoform X2 n=1 Tax=Papilio xuthus TaxID=66420 RepID=A0AAJ6Z874_PAPXU|nr:PREDICTED: N-acetyltransferase 9 isoform X2 [Papilio xuthus]
MRLNFNTKILGKNTILVPYREHHVPKYHTWMRSEELQKLTASEPLTLEEEYKMQKTWQEDDDNSMIGDTNIFVIDNDNMVGEIEIMIAEETARGSKKGWEAVILMLLYGIKFIKIKTFEAKISIENIISINMFQKLNFKEKSRSEIFQEVTLEKVVDNNWTKSLEGHFEFQLQTYK